MSKPCVLVTWDMDTWLLEQSAARFDLQRMWTDGLSPEPERIRGMLTSGIAGAPTELLGKLPALEIVSSFGVGYDAVDIATCRQRGIALTNTPGVLDDCVADLALGLLLSVSRRIPQADRFVRAGRWTQEKFHPAVRASGKRCGIVGMGNIGRAIARRLEGFGMKIAYTGPRPKDVPYRYVPSVLELARNSDFLLLALPGGAATRGVVGREVLEALGPQGVLINIARGSVVDEAALVELLAAGRLGGAGLDVLEHEPEVPAALLKMDNVVVTPHCGSYTHETRRAMAELTLANLCAHFEGRPLPSPVL